MPTPEEEAAAKAAAEKEAADAKAKADADAEAAARAKADDEKLGEGGKAALDAERKLRSDAEAKAKASDKAAREAQAKLKEIEDANLSATEKLQKEAEEGKALSASATDKLRKANLITALADQGLTGSKAKAAARLLDDVQFDDDDEPTNLDAALKAAKAEYGDDVFKPAKAGAAKINGAEQGEQEQTPALTAEQLDAAKAFGMTAEDYAKYQDPQYRGEPAKAKTPAA